MLKICFTLAFVVFLVTEFSKTMLKLILSLTSVLLFINLNAQEESQIETWQQQHPKVVFISYDSYQLLSPKERDILKNKEVIYFNGEISMEDIYSYESSSLDKSTISISDDAEYIKQWISNNPNVKIIKNATFQSASSFLQTEYLECAYCIILDGDEIRLSDIENFEQEKH